MGPLLRSGVVRTVDEDGNIEEYSKKEFEKHGLCRKVFANGVAVTLYRNGQTSEQFFFDAAFQTTAAFNIPADGSSRVLKLKPADFRFSNETLLTRMLRSPPVSEFRMTAFLRKLRPLDLSMLQHFWNLAET